MKNVRFCGFVVFYLFSSLFLSVKGQYVPQKGDHLRNYKDVAVKYLDKDKVETIDIQEARYFVIFQEDNLGETHGTELIFYLDSTLFTRKNYNRGVLNGLFSAYYPNQNLQSQGEYSKGMQIGLWQYWYENGQMKEERFYSKEIQEKRAQNFPYYQIYNIWSEAGEQTVKDGSGLYDGDSEPYIYNPDVDIFAQGNLTNGFRTGLWVGTRETGEKYYEEEYKNGLLIKGISYDSANNTYTYNIIEEIALPKNGIEAFYRQLSKYIIYPKSARKKGIEGRVFIQFVVNKTGNLEDIKVLKGISPDCDQAAVNALKQMPPWNPGLIRGQVVRQKMSIPILFKL